MEAREVFKISFIRCHQINGRLNKNKFKKHQDKKAIEKVWGFKNQTWWTLITRIDFHPLLKRVIWNLETASQESNQDILIEAFWNHSLTEKAALVTEVSDDQSCSCNHLRFKMRVGTKIEVKIWKIGFTLIESLWLTKPKKAFKLANGTQAKDMGEWLKLYLLVLFLQLGRMLLRL